MASSGPDSAGRQAPSVTLADRALAERSLRALGLPGPFTMRARFRSGASGAGVLAVEVDGRQAVLKVCEDPDGRDRAVRELHCYRRFGRVLRDFVPALLASSDDTDGVRLLLAAHRPLTASTALPLGCWLDVAERLGRWQRLSERLSWADPAPLPSTDPYLAAEAWTAAGMPCSVRDVSTLLLTATDVSMPGRPVLVHGDSHVGNLVRARDGRVLWIDWPEVRTGDGLEDLVFLWLRAEFDGASPPRRAMVRAYVGARGLPLGEALQRALDSTELRLLLLAWPPFLSYGAPVARERLAGRLRRLADECLP